MNDKTHVSATNPTNPPTDTIDTMESVPYFRMPALSPDGKHLVFAYAADLWHVDASGGTAERLTAHPAGHSAPCFSPDGTMLAFTSNRTGSGEIYVLPLNGGELRQLTHHGSHCSVEDWSADGKHIYFTSNRDGLGDAVYRVPLAGGTPAPIFAEPYENLDHVKVSPDGSTLALNIPRNAWWRLGPDPFAPCNIWLLPNQHQHDQHTEQPPAAHGDSGNDNNNNNNNTGKNSNADDQHGVQDNRLLFPSLLQPADALPTTQRPLAVGRWPLWSPDGSGVYFVSDLDGIENIWFQPLEGEPQKLTHFTDGRVLWPSIARDTGMIVFEREWRIWQLDPTSGETAPIPVRVRSDTRVTPVRVEYWGRGFSEMCLSPDGNKIAFVARGQIFADFADKETDKEMRQGPAFRVTNSAARESQVVWTPDSHGLIYVSDRHGEDELYHYDFTRRTERRLTSDPCSKSSPCCSPDGTWVAYVRGIDSIYLLNLRTGEEPRQFTQGNFLRSGSLAWSPDSRWLAYISHDAHFFGNVSVQRIDETESHQITFLSNIMSYDLHWSSNGRFLIFTSGQYRMESQIVRVDLRHPAPFLREVEFEKLFKDDSPDKAEQPPRPDEPGTPENGNGNGDEDSDETQHTSDTPASPAPEGEAHPDHGNGNGDEETDDTETPDGKASTGDTPPTPDAEENRQEQIPPVIIVFEGIERRLSFLTPIQMDAEACAISSNSRDLLFTATVAGKTNIWTLPLDEPRRDNPPQQITANSTSKNCVQFAPDGKRFYFLDDDQITIRKFPTGRDPVLIHTRGDVRVDFQQEKRQVFGEAWRLLRDMFYDPTFRGQDWEAIRERFAPVAAGAQTTGDLRAILNLMVGELRTSHLGAFWAGRWHSGDGYTGVLFDPYEQVHGGQLRVLDLVPDSPAALVDEPPRAGEYLVAVEGTPITPQTNLDELLQRTVGRRVLLTFADAPDSSSARELAIRPVDNHTYSLLRYRSWVAANETYVHRMSNGRLGYVHVPEMSYQAYQEFLVNLDVETHNKEGVVLDIRYNRGGHIATFILDVLTRRGVVLSGFRDRLSTDAYHYSGNRALSKPTVLVANESSASNAEIFTEIYRRLGLGRVVGTPTAGAVIGTVERALLNRIIFRLPLYSISTPEGENLEGTGRAVDVPINQPPGAWAANHDYQLEAAVLTLLDTIGNENL